MTSDSLLIQLIQQILMEVLLGGQYHAVGTEADDLGSKPPAAA